MKTRTGSPSIAIAAVSVLIALALAISAGCGSSGSGTGGTKPPPQRHYLAVADNENNRVLIYDSPFSMGLSASVVLGQPNMTSGGWALSATGMDRPAAALFDSNGNLYIADQNNSRVLQFKPPFSNGMSASLVLGEPDFVTATGSTGQPTQSNLHWPDGLAFDGSGNLWVADSANSRVVEYQPPFTNGMNASLVIGAADFTSFGQGPTSSELNMPASIAFDSGGNLWVADLIDNRVLEFKTPFSNGMSASLVLGQSDFVSRIFACSGSGLTYPYGIAFDSAGNLWMADANNRVLQFTPPFSSDMSASLVYPKWANNRCTRRKVMEGEQNGQR